MNETFETFETFETIFDGLMLGDGGLVKPSKNALYSHSCSKISYLYYLKPLMERFGLSFAERCPYTYPHKKHKGISSLLISHRNIYLTRQYERWYPERKKIVPLDLELTPDVCRHWYCGDGHLGHSHNRVNHIVLNTNGFSDIDRELLQEKLKNKGWKSSILNQGRIYIGKEHFEDVLFYMVGSPVSCYEYKWITNYEKYKIAKNICKGL